AGEPQGHAVDEEADLVVGETVERQAGGAAQASRAAEADTLGGCPGVAKRGGPAPRPPGVAHPRPGGGVADRQAGGEGPPGGPPRWRRTASVARPRARTDRPPPTWRRRSGPGSLHGIHPGPGPGRPWRRRWRHGEPCGASTNDHVSDRPEVTEGVEHL